MPSLPKRCRPCREGACEDCNSWTTEVFDECCCDGVTPVGYDPDDILTSDALVDSELADAYIADLDMACRRRPRAA